MIKKFICLLAIAILTLLPLGSQAFALSSNPIANPSVASAAGSAPAAWSTGNWGTNTAEFGYVTNDGHGDNTSVKLNVSNYTDGDAKWLFNPINLSSGQYRFSAWYKTNTTPKIVAMYTEAGGTTKYFGMPSPFPPANATTVWQPYSDTFSVPAGATNVSVFFFLDRNGWLQTDDYSIQDYIPNGFNRPLVSLTFDDGHEDNVTNALPVMNQYGLKSTQCYATMYLTEVPQTEAKATINAFQNSGHEICSHTVSHPDLATLTPTQLTAELRDSKAYLENLAGKPVNNFASPFGSYNEAVNNEIKKFYTSHRTVDEGYNSKDNFDIYRLRVQNVTPTTTMSEYQNWLRHAAATHTWLVLVYHDVVNADKTPTPYGSYTEQFKQQMAALSASGLTVKTYADALAEVKPQLGTTTPPVTPPATPSNPQASKPLYRMANWKTHERLFTTDLAEAQYAVNHYEGWVLEGEAMRVYDAPATGRVAVYRMANWKTHERLFTTDLAEAHHAVANYEGWVLEGVAFYASTDAGDKPVYRMANWATQERLFTTDLAEAHYAVRNYHGWVLEGVAFYAAK